MYFMRRLIALGQGMPDRGLWRITAELVHLAITIFDERLQEPD